MPDAFIIRALTAGAGIAAVAGVLGCFVVWRRMAYFGDALAHSALLGVAAGFVAGLGANLGTIAVCMAFCVTLTWLRHRRVLATDTLLGILAHAGLSLGLLVVSAFNIRIDLHAYLFGDILTVTPGELAWIFAGGALVLALLARCWQSLVLLSINEDLAAAEGVHTLRMQLLFMFLMTIVVAVSMRIIGVLLITSLLIIPAATAKQFAKSPGQMAAAASLLGVAAVAAGIAASYHFDLPSGPSIVAASAALFACLLPLGALVRARAPA